MVVGGGAARGVRRNAFLRRPRCLCTLPDERYGSPGLSGAATVPARAGSMDSTPHSASFGERLLHGG